MATPSSQSRGILAELPLVHAADNAQLPIVLSASDATKRKSTTTSPTTCTTQSSTRNKESRKYPSFPVRLYKILTEASSSSPQDDAIVWICSGEAFTIDRFHSNLSQVLAKHFQHGSYKSFTRQVRYVFVFII